MIESHKVDLKKAQRTIIKTQCFAMISYLFLIRISILTYIQVFAVSQYAHYNHGTCIQVPISSWFLPPSGHSFPSDLIIFVPNLLSLLLGHDHQ